MNLIKVNRTFNGMSVMIDSKNDLAPLADYIGSHSNFEPVEIRYQMGTDTGIILVHHSGTFADIYGSLNPKAKPIGWQQTQYGALPNED